MDDSKPRPDGKPVSKMPGGAGVGTPFAGESSSGGETIVPQNSAPTSGSVAESVDPGATMVGSGPVQFDPNATVIDTGAELGWRDVFRRSRVADRRRARWPL